jgi:ceramide glucosyltransferase
MIVLWWLLAALSCAACAYLLLAMAAVLGLRLERGPGWRASPGVTVLKPLCGDEDGLEAAIESFVAQAVPGAVTHVFGVADGGDPALAVARRVAARHPGVDCRFVVDATVHGANPKVSNLVNMARALPEGLGEVVVISDSDIVIAPGVLARAVDRLAEDGVGAVTALYRARPGRCGDQVRRLGAWFIDYWFLPMAVLHARLAPLQVTYGPLTAVRREVLAAAGGLEALAPHLSDDAELG